MPGRAPAAPIDEPPDVTVARGRVSVFVPPPGRLSADAARRLASDLVVAAPELDHQSRAAAMRGMRRESGPREGTPYRLPDQRSTRGALK